MTQKTKVVLTFLCLISTIGDRGTIGTENIKINLFISSFPDHIHFHY